MIHGFCGDGRDQARVELAQAVSSQERVGPTAVLVTAKTEQGQRVP